MARSADTLEMGLAQILSRALFGTLRLIILIFCNLFESYDTTYCSPLVAETWNTAVKRINGTKPRQRNR